MKMKLNNGSKLKKMLIIGGVIGATLSMPVYGFNLDQVLLNGSPKTLAHPIIKTEASVLISLRDLASASGMTLSWNSEKKAAICVYGEKTYEFIPDSATVTEGYEKLTLSKPVSLIDNLSYIPLNAITDIFKGNIELKEDSYAITLKAPATGERYDIYTFEQLYQIAMDKSVDLQQAKTSLDRADFMYENNSNKYGDSSPIGTGNGANDSMRLTQLLSLENSEITKQSADLTIETTKDTIRYQLLSAMNSVTCAYSAQHLAEKELNLQREIYRQISLKHDLGLVSQYEFDNSGTTLKSKETAVGIKASAVSSAKNTLESILKLGIDKYSFLDNGNIGYSPLSERDLETHIKNVLQESPTLWNLDKAVYLNELGLKYYVFNGTSYDTYEASEMDVTKAKQTLQIAKDSTDKAMRSAYEQIIQLEKNYDTLQFELTKAKKDLEMVVLNKNVGLSTDLAIKQSQYVLDALNNQILNLKSSYELLKEGYLKPWSAQ